MLKVQWGKEAYSASFLKTASAAMKKKSCVFSMMIQKGSGARFHGRSHFQTTIVFNGNGTNTHTLAFR